MDETNIKLYRASLALYGAGTLLYCVDFGIYSIFRFTLFLSGVLALSVAWAPISRMQTTFYVFLLVLSLFSGTILIAMGLAGGRDDVNPDPLADISTGLSILFFSVAIFFHYQTVRSSPARALRWLCCFVGLMLVANTPPYFFEPTLRAQAIPLAILGLPFFLYFLIPMRLSFNIVAGVMVAWILWRGYATWTLIGIEQYGRTDIEDISRVTFSGLLCYLVAVTVELWRFRLLTVARA